MVYVETQSELPQVAGTGHAGLVLLQLSFVHQFVELQDQIVVIPQAFDQALLLLPAEHQFTVELLQDHGVPQACVYQAA